MNFSTTFQKLLKGTVRVVLFVVATVLVVALLSGCGKTADTSTLDGHGKRFEVIYKDATCYVVVDMETGVEYAVSAGTYNGGTFTMLYDSYGNPYIFPGFDAREDRLPND